MENNWKRGFGTGGSLNMSDPLFITFLGLRSTILDTKRCSEGWYKELNEKIFGNKVFDPCDAQPLIEYLICDMKCTLSAIQNQLTWLCQVIDRHNILFRQFKL